MPHSYFRHIVLCRSVQEVVYTPTSVNAHSTERFYSEVTGNFQNINCGRKKHLPLWDYRHVTEIPVRLRWHVNTYGGFAILSVRLGLCLAQLRLPRSSVQALNETLAPHLKYKTVFQEDRQLPGQSYHAQISQFTKLAPILQKQ